MYEVDDTGFPRFATRLFGVGNHVCAGPFHHQLMEPFNHLIQALERRDYLADEERRLLHSLPLRRRHFTRGSELVAQDSEPTESCLMLSGFTARVQTMQDGRRQIAAVHMAGDFVDLHSFVLKRMDHSVVAISDCEAAFVRHDALREVFHRSPHLGRLFWLLTAIDAAIHRTWITSLGRRTSFQSLAHLVCEIYTRAKAVGLTRQQSFELPVTQAELGDILGLSTVHVNRTLRDLRATGLVSWQGYNVTITDFDRLAKLAEFDEGYLSLIQRTR